MGIEILIRDWGGHIWFRRLTERKGPAGVIGSSVDCKYKLTSIPLKLTGCKFSVIGSSASEPGLEKRGSNDSRTQPGLDPGNVTPYSLRKWLEESCFEEHFHHLRIPVKLEGVEMWQSPNQG